MNGGTGPFGFNWTTGSTSSLANNLSSGIYGVTVSDKFGCKLSDVVSISDKNAPKVIANQVINPTCYDADNGSIEISVSNIQNTNITWSNGADSTFIGNLTAGAYGVTLADQNNCKSFESFTLSAPDSITVIAQTIEPSCGLNNGSIFTTISGGTTPYNINWTPGSSTADSIINIGAGVYEIEISDVNNCVSQKSIALNNFNSLILNVDSIAYPECGNNDGFIAVETTPPSANVIYNWSNGPTGISNPNLVSGIYNVTATDTISGCISVLSVNLPSQNIPRPELCLVSVDSTIDKVILTWDENAIPGVSSYTVMVQTKPNGGYIEYKEVPVSVGGILIDSIVDVNTYPVNYALRANGTCGVSKLSDPSNNMVLIYAQDQLGVSLFWNGYGENAQKYYIHRYTPTSGWVIIDSVNTDTTSFIDPNLPSPIPPQFYYAVEAKVDNNCVNSRAFSNISNNLGQVGIDVNEVAATEFGTVEMYPNPTLGELNINFNLIKNEEVELRIYTMQGQLVENDFLGEIERNSQYQIDLGHLDSGPYFVEIKTDDFVQKIPLIIQ